MNLIDIALAVAALLIAVSVGLTAFRMLRGPGIADRAVAFDLLGLLAVTGVALAALAGGHLALLDIALGLGLVGFIGTIGIAAFIERAGRARETRDE